MFSVEKNKLSDDLMPFDKQLTRTDDPLPKTYLTYIISGMKGSGKSTLLLNLLKRKSSPYYRWFDNIILFSPTANKDHKFEKLVKELDAEGKVFTELDEESLEKALKLIEDFNESFDEKEEKRKPHNLIIMDDCIHMMGSSQSKSLLNELFTTSRHKKASLWVCTQKYNKLPTLLRTNTDCISYFRNNNKADFKTLEDDLNIDPKLLEQVYEFATAEPNSFLHINMFNGKPKYFKKFDLIKLE